MDIRPRTSTDVDVVRSFLEDQDALRSARAGELVDALDYPALLAEDDGRLLGVLTYIPGEEGWEVLTFHASERLRGVGSALMAAVEKEARVNGSRRLFLTTTNDNLDALRFYQRRGFELVKVRRRAVDDSRTRLKQKIPYQGHYGIPLRDEILLELPL